MRAIIVAGGQGKRLRPLTEAIPKALVPVGGVPLLERQLVLLHSAGITEVTLATHHQSAVIEKFVGDGSQFGLSLVVQRETNPRGTAGAVRDIAAGWTEDFLVLYGDLLTDIDIARLTHWHQQRGSPATLLVHPNNHPQESDLVELAADGQIVSWHAKPHASDTWRRNLVSGAIYILSPEVLRDLPTEGEVDFGRDVFPRFAATGALAGYRTCEYVADVGTPEQLAAAETAIRLGVLERRRWSTPKAAVFLDRDGVINVYRDQLHRTEDFELLPGVAEAVRTLNHCGALVIVVTNQPAVARGLCTLAEVDRVHAKMDTLLGRQGAYVDAVYVCPHHPDKGFPGEQADLKISCLCRKPETGMLEQAARDWNIDLGKSVMIGDSWRDFACGRKAGLTTIGVQTGARWLENGPQPDVAYRDLTEAVTHVLARLSPIVRKPVAVTRTGEVERTNASHTADERQ